MNTSHGFANLSVQKPWFLPAVLVSVLLLWRDPMNTATLMKENIWLGWLTYISEVQSMIIMVAVCRQTWHWGGIWESLILQATGSSLRLFNGSSAFVRPQSQPPQWHTSTMNHTYSNKDTPPKNDNPCDFMGTNCIQTTRRSPSFSPLQDFKMCPYSLSARESPSLGSWPKILATLILRGKQHGWQ